MDDRKLRLATRVLALIAAVFILVMFGAFALRSYNDPHQPIPAELYPLAALAAGFLFGFGVKRSNNNKDEK